MSMPIRIPPPLRRQETNTEQYATRADNMVSIDSDAIGLYKMETMTLASRFRKKLHSMVHLFYNMEGRTTHFDTLSQHIKQTVRHQLYLRESDLQPTLLESTCLTVTCKEHVHDQCTINFSSSATAAGLLSSRLCVDIIATENGFYVTGIRRGGTGREFIPTGNMNCCDSLDVQIDSMLRDGRHSLDKKKAAPAEIVGIDPSIISRPPTFELCGIKDTDGRPVLLAQPDLDFVMDE